MLALPPDLRAPDVFGAVHHGSSTGELIAWGMLFVMLLALVTVPESLKRRRRAKARRREQSL